MPAILRRRLVIIGVSLIVLTAFAGGLAATIITVTRPKTAQNLTNLAAGGGVDTLSYLVGQHAVGQSADPKSLNGITNVAGKNYLYTVKSPNGVAYEYRTWDNNFIYLKQDTSIGPGNTPPRFSTATSYNLDPGLWMKRQMAVGETIQSISKLTFFKNCQAMDTPGDFHYTTTLEQVLPSYQAGGDIGKQNVIVLKYDYVTGFERFYYSREWGFIRWEEWNGTTKTMNRAVNFNSRITDPITNPKPVCGSPTPPPIVRTHKECVNNACVKVTGAGADNCPNKCQVTTPTPSPTPSPIASPTPAVGADAADKCWGGGGADGKCYDCNGDGTVNILDFTCFSKSYGKSI